MLGRTIHDGNIVQYLDNTAGLGGSIELSNVSTTNSLTVAVGGTGGAGGAGGDITVTNTGSVATMGIMSDAIVVQSIGGGGGKGGGRDHRVERKLDEPRHQLGRVAVGGGTQGSSSDPYATNGAQASITNTGTIFTTGAICRAASSPSRSAWAAASAGPPPSPTPTADGKPGARRSVSRSVAAPRPRTAFPRPAQVTSSGAIQTLGHDSYGIIAQSISGGGGIAKTVAANLDYRRRVGNIRLIEGLLGRHQPRHR